MTQTKFNFTDQRLRKMKHDGSSKRNFYYDTIQHGLALQVMPSGTKTFQLRVWDRINKRTVIKSLSRYPNTAIQQAREEVNKLAAEINKGIDVLEQARSVIEEEVFDSLFFHWIELHAKPHKRSWDEDLRRYHLYIEKSFGKKKASWFTPEKIREWHFNITKLPKQRGKGYVSQATANRTLALVSTVFSQMLPERTNPCRGVKKFREKSRDRFLHPDELKRFFEALNNPETSDTIRDYLYISLFTGARRGNVMSMKWVDLDLLQNVWTIPADESKNAEKMEIPLVPHVTDILLRRKKTTSSVFVFASQTSKSGHMVEPRKAWITVLKRAGLHNVRLHDLRRTMGSYQTITGASTAIVGKTLGHKSPESTSVYARMTLDPVRASMEVAVEAMLASQNLQDKVKNIK